MYKHIVDLSNSKSGSPAEKLKLKRDYLVSAGMSTLLFVPWGIYYALPTIINKMLCDEQAKKFDQSLKCTTDESRQYHVFKYLIYASAVTYVLGWVIQSGNAKVEIDDIELRPDEVDESDKSDDEADDCSDSDHHHSDDEMR